MQFINNIKSKFQFRLILSFILIIPFSNIYSQHYTEYEVKAGYIYNFTKFINWPEQAFDSDNENFIIGIYGKDPFGLILNMVLKGQKLLDRNWTIKYYYDVSEIDKCHILFVAKASKSELLAIFEKLKNKPVLTVGDEIEEFCERGGMINFTGKFDKKRFEINNNSALRVKLSISLKLLVLARIISDNEIKF
ncbi:MAG: YfiR family protein [Bacteroidota bacterium]